MKTNKNMKQKLKLVISITTMLFIFKCCKPDKGCVDNNTYKYQLEEDLKILPYNDFSQLTFINKTTRDTFVFIGEGYNFDWGKYTTQEECSQTYNLQRRFIIFSFTKNSEKITIENLFVQSNVRKMAFSYKKNGRNTSYSDFGYPFTYDSILIEGKYYNKITQFNPEKSTVSLGFLYSLNNGIVQLIYPPNNDTLNLIKLEL